MDDTTRPRRPVSDRYQSPALLQEARECFGRNADRSGVNLPNLSLERVATDGALVAGAYQKLERLMRERPDLYTDPGMACESHSPSFLRFKQMDAERRATLAW